MNYARFTLLAGFLVLSASLASAATFTAVANGDWQSAATWGTSGSGCHVAYPCKTDAYSGGPANGDNVNLAGFTVTCTNANEVCTAGSSGSTSSNCTVGTAAIVNGSGSGGLTIGSTATLIYAGPVCLTFGTITLQQGAKIYHDSSWASTPTSYTFLGTDSSTHSAIWAVGTPGGTRVVWEGDSFNSPQKYFGNCASANSAGCEGGTLGGNVVLESGEGSFYNLTIQNLGNTGTAFVNYTINTQATLFSGLIMTNSGILSIRMGGSKSVTIDKSKFTATSVTNLGNGCLNLTSFSGSATMTVTNSVFECPIVPTTNYTGIVWRNDVCSTTWASGGFYTPGSSNLRPCFIGSDSATYDQMLFYSDGWNTTTSENSTNKGSMGVVNLTNSIGWAPRNIGLAGGHNHPLQQRWQGLTGGTWVQRNNVYGSFGDTETAGTEAHQTGNPGGGNPTSATTLTVTGNVNLCGFAGRGSMTGNGQFLSSGTVTNFAADSITVTNNTYCASAASLGSTSQSDGAAAAEAGTYNLNTVGYSGANTYFRADGVGAGAVPAIFDASANSTYVANPPWHRMIYNAILNTGNSFVGSAPCGTAGNNCAWISIGPTASTEIIQAAQTPGMIDPVRSVPLFSEYLDASGIYPITNYTGAAQYRGQWTSGTAYSQGDIVYYQNAGVYNNRKTYWICKTAHISGSTNNPISGSDPSNPFAGPTPYWEDAWLSMWMKPAILAGTAYSDGALPPLYNSSTMYAVGLLNAWLRQGFMNIDPRLWGGASGAPGCSANGGITWTECGAVPLTPIQHIPPAPALN
jgi:hypothetical protein